MSQLQSPSRNIIPKKFPLHKFEKSIQEAYFSENKNLNPAFTVSLRNAKDHNPNNKTNLNSNTQEKSQRNSYFSQLVHTQLRNPQTQSVNRASSKQISERLV